MANLSDLLASVVGDYFTTSFILCVVGLLNLLRQKTVQTGLGQVVTLIVICALYILVIQGLVYWPNLYT